MAAERVQRRARLTRADIFADQVRFGDGDVKFGRRLRRIVGRIFDDETFLAGVGWACALSWFCSAANGQHLQTQVTANAVLQMDDVIAFFQVREVNIERRPGCLSVGRF